MNANDNFPGEPALRAGRYKERSASDAPFGYLASVAQNENSPDFAWRHISNASGLRVYLAKQAAQTRAGQPRLAPRRLPAAAWPI